MFDNNGIDYLDKGRFDTRRLSVALPVNSCVSCGAEMPEGNQVCKACVESWTNKADKNTIIIDENPHYFINGRELDCDKAYDWFQEAINEKAEREKATTQESLHVQRKSAESSIFPLLDAHPAAAGGGRMTTIRAVSYKESRLDYFRRKAAKCRKTLWWWQCQKPGKQYSEQTIHGMRSDLGWEIGCLDDVIEMLEKMGVEA